MNPTVRLSARDSPEHSIIYRRLSGVDDKSAIGDDERRARHSSLLAV